MRNTALRTTALLALAAMLFTAPTAALADTETVYYINGVAYTGSAEGTSAASGTAPTSGTAAYTAYSTSLTGVNKETVIIRKAATSSATAANKVASVKRGNTFTILGESGSYYYVQYESYQGFARKKDFTVSGSASTATETTAPSYTAYTQSYTGVNKETVVIRKIASSATTAANKVASVKKGNTFTILGENGSFYYVQYESYQGFARKKDFTVSGTVSASTTTTTTSVSNPTSDTWGHLQIDGTNINQSIMANTVINGRYKYETSGMQYFYALTDYSSQISIILGHNLRSSGTRFHQLHHVQNAWLGKSTCEYCGKSCGSAQTRYFNMSWQGYTKWELVCFYETEHGEPASTLEFNGRPYNTSASTWLNYQLSRAASSSKGMVVGSATSGDKLVMLIGCGDYYSKTSNGRIYVVLKAVS